MDFWFTPMQRTNKKIMLAPMYLAIRELYIEIIDRKENPIYICRYSYQYGEWRVKESQNIREILSIIENKIRNGYLVKTKEEYKRLYNLLRKE